MILKFYSVLLFLLFPFSSFLFPFPLPPSPTLSTFSVVGINYFNNTNFSTEDICKNWVLRRQGSLPCAVLLFIYCRHILQSWHGIKYTGYQTILYPHYKTASLGSYPFYSTSVSCSFSLLLFPLMIAYAKNVK